MQSLVKIRDVFYFRLRIPKDVTRYFPRPEIVKSLRTEKYILAKPLARRLLGETERIFAMIRSKVLDADGIQTIVSNFMHSVLEQKYDAAENFLSSPEMQDVIQEIHADAHKASVEAVKRRGEVGPTHLPFTAVDAEYLCQTVGYEADQSSPEFKRLTHQLAIAKRDIIKTLQERLDTGDSSYDAEQRKKREKEREERSKSNSLSELIASYCEAKGNVTGQGRKGKVSEKMNKIVECFAAETGTKDVLLADIDYQLTLRVGKRLATYPLYRNVRYKGLTLDQIDKLEGVERSSLTTTKEELSRLSGLYDDARTRMDGLKKNYAKKLSEAVLGKPKGKSKGKASDAKDIFRHADIMEILRGLRVFKDKDYFDKNPHLLFITLIGLFCGPRINEICQLKVTDILQVDGIWCINHTEDSEDKSLKNMNSVRINPIHPALLDFGLLRFRDAQVAKNYSGLWDGGERHRCDFYEKSGNCSHYVSKWWNGTFKDKLTLSNPKKQTFHSTRHTFINWFKQNVRGLDYEARNALSGHLDKEDIAALEQQGFDAESEGEITYSKGLNVKRQLELLEKLDYGVDLSGLKII